MSSRVPENWITQLRKGVLELCILNALRVGRGYGYDIVRRLREIDGLMIGEGTVYPILSRLKREGYLETAIEESSEGPPRKLYRLTRSGRDALRGMNHHWAAMVDGIAPLIEESRG